MNRDEFISKRQREWKRFQVLLDRAEQERVKKLTGQEIAELSGLYRGLCYDLSLVQSRDWGTSMSRFLNGLVARGHNVLYRSQPGSLDAVIQFFVAEFPRLLRANYKYFLVAFFFSVVPGTICGILVAYDTSLAGRILPGQVQAQMELSYSESIAGRNTGSEGMMAGFYVRNNVGIAFKCFALGAFAGIGTITVLTFNSIFLGTVTGYLIGRGHQSNFFEFVVGHGSFELTAIVISGTAGLMLGNAIVHPGQKRRWDALRERGLDSVKIALGAGVMLIIAALIEGFWSPSGAIGGISDETWRTIKMYVGGMLWVFVGLYLALGGRTKMTSVGHNSSEVAA
ncbi:stage II sporulation protein M [Thalassoglobus sp.]|uniref:stage II sporulation protein M n=1 Tax=Thalassoglobus sp. TaxID=2795869 RepID=UPI003AA7C5D5